MTVYLVGAGPGPRGLLSLRAAELLASTEVVVHDRLVSDDVLSLVAPTAQRHDVGKSPGKAPSQAEVNELLVELAGRHESVVRLKGGDPFVFGRGGEEAIALRKAGVSFEVVPGISSVNGVLASAGIPLTHRGLSQSFTVVTGQGATSGVDWESLAALGGTIVVLMGVARRQEIARRLVEGGLSSSTPVAVVERGGLLGEQTVRTSLGELAATEPATPAVIVIGEVAALDLTSPRRDRSLDEAPLHGWRVAVTRPPGQASVLSRLLVEAGAEPVEVPTIALAEPDDGGEALRARLAEIDSYDWICFTSANAVHYSFAKLRDARRLGSVKVAAIGEATAASLLSHGVVADLVAALSTGEGLAGAFPPAEKSTDKAPRVLLPQAARARRALADGLRALGYLVESAVAYKTVELGRNERAAGALEGTDAIAFSSSSTIEGFLAAYGKKALPPVVATIGPVTSATARQHGVPVDVEAPRASSEALVEALAAFARKGGPQKRSLRAKK